MMKPTRKLNKVMLNGVLSCVLAMGIGTTAVYADGNDTSVTTSATTDTVAIQPVSDNGQTLTWTGYAPEGLIRAIISLAEKIQIVFTVDGTERGKLLDSLTQDKIKDANEQLEAGQTDLAASTLNNAISNQSLAILLTALISPTTDVEADKEDKSDKADKTDKEDSKDKNEAKKKAVIAKQIRHNIEQLTHVLNKVQNPTAKAELEQKINNKLDELSKKLEALQASIDQQPQAQATVVTQPATTVKAETKLAQTKIKANNDKDDEDEDDDADDNDAKQEAHEKSKELIKAEHEKEKAAKKEAHAKWKAIHKQLKEDNQGEDDDHDDDNDD
ncbi:hypothetical protein H8B09_23255 [Paenibacillus sp. PR3]|uniref:Uncharacterized protein n=1 Tax=Paenibacillus terricola TaxID=2763503 RepID=A0ABR8N0H9_9BACL|nr:hypothetical protein [Paenibacillus terricola]MBD3921703.1 hypothetical protein [Paenibacillus terricola]